VSDEIKRYQFYGRRTRGFFFLKPCSPSIILQDDGENLLLLELLIGLFDIDQITSRLPAR
jgi:hypothetical protein